MKKTKKAISVLLSLVLLPGVLPASALASETGQSVPVCICDTLCTGENINQDCPVCGAEGADLARCAGTGESGTGLPTDTEPPTGTEPAAQTCICDTLCTDGSVNGGCPVCGGEGADLSKCLGKQVAEPTPEATPEPTQETTPEPTPETTPGPTPEAPEQEEAADEVDAAVAEVQAQIDALPAADGLAVMSQEEQQAVYTQVQAAYDAYNALTDEQKGQIAGAEIFDSLFGVFNGMVNALAENVTYLDADGQMQNCESATDVTTELTAWVDGWYVVSNDVTIDSRVTVTGDVHLILADSAVLTVNGGIQVAEGNSLTIYSQSVDESMGALIAKSVNDGAGIGSGFSEKGGTLTINGGKVTATGAALGAGIGGGNYGTSATVTINGGIVTATGANYGAGIGSGGYGTGNNVTINGGTVVATGGMYGAGIGGGGNANSEGIPIKITGGAVDATGKEGGAGIGGGCFGYGTANVVITGGIVEAKAEQGNIYCGSGIGNGDEENGITFSTGENGNAIIFASSISGNNDTANWQGIIFQKTNGQVYGNPALQQDVMIPENHTLTITAENTLTVPANVTLNTATGVSINHYGTITGSGTLDGTGILFLRDDGSVADTVTNKLKTIDVMKTETIDNEIYYLIENADQLVTFSNIVNDTLTEEEAQVYTPSTAVNGKLVANIDLNPGFTFASDGSYTGPEETEPEIWNTMGQSESSGVYSGTFDGDGYAVSGVYINTNDGCQGLFGSITGTVRNLRVENSYISSGNGNSAGGIVAINWSGTVENCAFSGSVRGYNRVGGIVGRNRNGIVQNCYNTGTIQATQTGNGIAGTNNEKSAQVINCFTTTGSIAEGGNITNSYYLSNSSSAAEALTAEEMSGPNAVTTMEFDSTLWTSGGESQWERTELDDGTVANILCGYLPHPSIFDEKQEFDWVALDSESGMSTQTDEDGKTYYLITNAAELATFRNIVNNTLTAKEAQIYTPNASANGRLVNDIDLNPGYTFAADGAYTYSGEGEAPGVRNWIPIGTENRPYTGTFDGNGHTISSIYINAPSADYQGLFGDVRSGGIVRMVGVVNSYVFASGCVGGVVGANVNGGIVQNCYNTGSVSAGRNDGYVGGVAGYNYGTIQNCYNTGAVSVSGGDSSVGGVVGWNEDTVQNCYNTGRVNADASSYNGGIAGFNITAATITNCYYLNTSASTGIGSGTGGATSLTAGQMTGSDALGQGETQMNLDTTVWTTGSDTTFWQDTGTVDENGQRVFGLMAQLPQLTVFADAGKDHEKIPVQTTTPSLSTQTDEDGKTYYLITNVADLVTFRNIVNNTLTAEEAQFYTADASSNGRLVNDIDLNPGYTFAADGTYTYSGKGEASGVQSWTPMGTEERQYTGIFDGGGHTVSGVYIDNGSGRQGLFGSVDSGGMIQNLGVVNSYIRAGGYYVGGIVGCAGSVTITSCFSSAAVIGTGFETSVGGIVGGAYGATIENCYNAGMIHGEGNSARIGGVVGYINNNAVENCYSTGSVSGNGWVGGVAGWVQGGSVINCYYLDTSASVGIDDGSGDAKPLTIAQIEDAGENGLMSLLTANVPAGQENPWNNSLSAVGAWTSGKPAVQPVFIWQMVIQNTPTYSVIIPEKATINSDAVDISANAGAFRADQTVEVEVDANNIFSLSNGGTDSLTYQIFAGDSSDSVEAGETVLSTGNTRETTSASIRFALKEGEVPSYAGIYTGTCTFVVSVKQSAS